jgi:NADH:ubiquinone reductase (H+-translocating)
MLDHNAVVWAVDAAEAAILLVEGADRVLPTFPPDLSATAERALAGLGVRVRTHSTVTDLDSADVTIRTGDSPERIPAKTVLWAAGVAASELGKILSQRTVLLFAFSRLALICASVAMDGSLCVYDVVCDGRR